MRGRTGTKNIDLLIVASFGFPLRGCGDTARAVGAKGVVRVSAGASKAGDFGVR